MAHYAFLDENNIVTEVIVGIDEAELIEGKEPETWYAEFRGQVCKRTSYNGNIRKNFAGIGMIFSEELDAFIYSQPFPSWVLNPETAIWEAPVAPPELIEGKEQEYRWNEESFSWVEVKEA
jgi:hypothetical protein